MLRAAVRRVHYDTASNLLYLRDDSAPQWVGSGVLGSAATLSNSQCTVNLANSSITTAGTSLTLNLALSFSASFAGTQNLYLLGNSGDLNSGWTMVGTWTVPTPSGSLPSGWSSYTVGNASGTASYVNGVYTLAESGGGLPLGVSNDSGYEFVAQPMVGDGTIQARITSVQNVGGLAWYGIQLRTAPNPYAAGAAAGYYNGWNVTEIVWRTDTGANTNLGAEGPSLSTPFWVRLVRAGQTVSGYYSLNGIDNWEQLGTTQTITMGTTTYVGLVVAGGGTVTFDNLAVNRFSISASPSTLTTPLGGTVSSTVTETAGNGFADSVAYSGVSLPPGVTATFNPAALGAAGNTMLTLSASAGAAPGTYAVTIAVTDTVSGETHFVPLTLAIPFPYGYVRAITIDHTKVPNSDLSNFPFLVNGVYPSLATVSNGGHVASASGYDIAFATDSACQNTLNYEMELWNGNTGQTVAWVQVPTVSHTADTTIYVCYGNSSINTAQGNATAVWDSNYKMVQHLPNGVTLSANDSTVNGNNGSITSPTATAGQIGGAAAFNGTSDKISVGTVGFPIGNAPRSASFWFNATNFLNNYNDVFSYGSPTPEQAFGFSVHNNQLVFTGWYDDLTSVTSISTGQWYYVVGTFDGTTAQLYINGNLDSSASKSGWNTVITAGYIGEMIANDSEYFNGTIDEVRVSSTVRSADWISAEYNNQSSPSTFYSVGQETTP